MNRIRTIDSHTEGEPTRVVIEGGPDLLRDAEDESVAAQLRVFRERFDWFRSAVVNEPRGSEHLVGALLVPSRHAGAASGVIFFNNVGFLNGCGHGTMGVVATLRHLGRVGVGEHVIETPIGIVTARIQETSEIELENVTSYRYRARVPIEFGFRGRRVSVTGDIAWGGNWFFLCDDHGLRIDPTNIEELREFTLAIRHAIRREGIRAAGDSEIDHIELFGPPARKDCMSKNYVMCPGGEHDRSPCGTGTSAKLACLHADGTLKPGESWNQESIIGSRFRAKYELPLCAAMLPVRAVVPWIRGGAWVTAETTLVLDERDPFVHGIRR